MSTGQTKLDHTHDFKPDISVGEIYQLLELGTHTKPAINKQREGMLSDGLQWRILLRQHFYQTHHMQLVGSSVWGGLLYQYGECIGVNGHFTYYRPFGRRTWAILDPPNAIYDKWDQSQSLIFGSNKDIRVVINRDPNQPITALPQVMWQPCDVTDLHDNASRTQSANQPITAPF